MLLSYSSDTQKQVNEFRDPRPPDTSIGNASSPLCDEGINPKELALYNAFTYSEETMGNCCTIDYEREPCSRVSGVLTPSKGGIAPSTNSIETV
jgi:hypothetical protein